jgi:uncharacterized protein
LVLSNLGLPRQRILNLGATFTLSLGLFSLTSGCSSFYYFPDAYQYIKPAQFKNTPEDIWFKSSDGTRLHGWYFKAQCTDGQTSPAVIVHFHGNGQNLTSHILSMHRAPQECFDYFIFDYRGYGLSSGKPEPAGVIEDGRAALRWTREKFGDKPIVVYAQSLGGAIALRLLGENTEPLVKVLVIDSSFLSYRSVARKIISKQWWTWLLQPVAWLVADNSKSPEHVIDQLNINSVLVVHGDKDQVVDFELGETLFAALGGKKEFWRIENGTHIDFMMRKNRYSPPALFIWLREQISPSSNLTR